MKDAYVCIVKVIEIRKGFEPAFETVVLNTSARMDDGRYRCWSGLELALPYFRTLTGRDPAVGDIFKLVTTPGEWK